MFGVFERVLYNSNNEGLYLHFFLLKIYDWENKKS